MPSPGMGCGPATIVGNHSIAVGDVLAVASAYEPPDAGPPISYEWSTDGLVSDQGAASAIYVWEQVGEHTITLTTTNCEGSAVAAAAHHVDVFGSMPGRSVINAAGQSGLLPLVLP